MAERIAHDVVVLADSDMVVRPDYLERLVAELSQDGVSGVTCLYHGVPAYRGLYDQLSALAIDVQFLPNVVMGLSLGLAKPCFGSTIAFTAGDPRRDRRLRRLHATTSPTTTPSARPCAASAAGWRSRASPSAIPASTPRSPASGGTSCAGTAPSATSTRPAMPARSSPTPSRSPCIGGAAAGAGAAALGVAALALACRIILSMRLERAFGIGPAPLLAVADPRHPLVRELLMGLRIGCGDMERSRLSRRCGWNADPGGRSRPGCWVAHRLTLPARRLDLRFRSRPRSSSFRPDRPALRP